VVEPQVSWELDALMQMHNAGCSRWCCVFTFTDSQSVRQRLNITWECWGWGGGTVNITVV
jgi:hypothetical protein